MPTTQTTLVSLASLPQKDWLSVLDFYNSHFPSSPWSMAYFSSFLNSQARQPRGFVLVIEDKISGLVLGRTFSNSTSVFQLTTLLVDPLARGNGYAKILMHKLFSELSKNQELKKIALHYRASNNLQSFYTSLGFTSHQTDGTYSNGETKFYMEKILN